MVLDEFGDVMSELEDSRVGMSVCAMVVSPDGAALGVLFQSKDSRAGISVCVMVVSSDISVFDFLFQSKDSSAGMSVCAIVVFSDRAVSVILFEVVLEIVDSRSGIDAFLMIFSPGVMEPPAQWHIPDIGVTPGVISENKKQDGQTFLACSRASDVLEVGLISIVGVSVSLIISTLVNKVPSDALGDASGSVCGVFCGH